MSAGCARPGCCRTTEETSYYDIERGGTRKNYLQENIRRYVKSRFLATTRSQEEEVNTQQMIMMSLPELVIKG